MAIIYGEAKMEGRNWRRSPRYLEVFHPIIEPHRNLDQGKCRPLQLLELVFFELESPATPSSLVLEAQHGIISHNNKDSLERERAFLKLPRPASGMHRHSQSRRFSLSTTNEKCSMIDFIVLIEEFLGVTTLNVTSSSN
jgi:hypothetical protein